MLLTDLLESDALATTAINSAHCAWLDPVMLFFSKVYVWVPIYLAVAVFYFFKFPWRKAVLAVIAVIAAFVFTDMFSHFLKEQVFMRYRPCEDPSLAGKIRSLEGPGSLYGFPSGHACNTFCFTLITSWLSKRRWWTITAFSWAAVVSYSRIYLGKHFLGDILGGIVFGMATGAVIILILHLLFKLIDKLCSA